MSYAIIHVGGNFLVYGAAKTPATTLTTASIGPGGAGNFIVGDTTGWQVGDTVTCEHRATGRPAWQALECRKTS